MDVLEQIKELLSSSSLPVAYRAFESPQKLPFICYVEEGTRNMYADNTVYSSQHIIRVQLYTERKDVHLERMLENLLNDFCWEKSEVYIESERMQMTEYEIEV